MMTLTKYMTKVGVSKAKYVINWLKKDSIPGVIKGNSWTDAKFPDSSRRPYCGRWLKPELPADMIRAHIVKACLMRQHITKETFFTSDGEFNGFIFDLENAELIRKRVEDGIVYYDSTIKSDSLKEKKLEAVRKSVMEAITACSTGLAQGTMKALLNKPFA